MGEGEERRRRKVMPEGVLCRGETFDRLQNDTLWPFLELLRRTRIQDRPVPEHQFNALSDLRKSWQRT
jgi:hypothetical protein